MNASTLLRASLLAAALGAALSVSAQNIVQDPGFESAVGAANDRTLYAPGQTVDGGSWFVGDPPSAGTSNGGVDKRPNFVISGTTSALLANASILQTLGTVAGQTYTVSFDALTFQGGSQSFSVDFGATTVPLLAVRDPARYSFVAAATDPSTVLRFNGFFPNAFLFDNVSVQAVPEPASFAALGLGALAMLRRRRQRNAG